MAGCSAHLVFGNVQSSHTFTQEAHYYLHSISCICLENILSHAQTYAKYSNKLGKFVNPYIINSIAINSNLTYSLVIAHCARVQIVALILIGLNNENLDSDKWVNGERSEKQGKPSLVLTSNEISDQRGDSVQAPSYAMSPPTSYSFVHPIILLLSQSPKCCESSRLPGFVCLL